MSGDRTPLVLGVAGTVLVGLIWWLIAGGGASSRPDPGGAMFSPAERDMLNAAPVGPGAAPAPPDASVDFTDPRAVARAYVVAGYSVRGSDAGRTNRRGTPYAAPGSPPNEVGVLPLTTPPTGRRSTATVTSVDQVAGEPTDTRRGYRVGYRSAEVTDGAAEPEDRRFTSVHNRYLVLERQFDGRWLVTVDSAESQVGEP
ncbi:hypothetical protein [Pseudonocardia spinosispora]|uniref:hypothetical protein n=1 Tax=Pseudonocardia spinosispora TaxID=103441 RepID=UPI0004072D5D|nr:hypothetical protein [Pseudonocardia spinosispora]